MAFTRSIFERPQAAEHLNFSFFIFHFSFFQFPPRTVWMYCRGVWLYSALKAR